MSDINWDLAPEGVTALKSDMHNNIYWVNDKNTPWVGTGWDNSSHHSSWKTIAIRPQESLIVGSGGGGGGDEIKEPVIFSIGPSKTVADVLNAFPNGWPSEDCTVAIDDNGVVVLSTTELGVKARVGAKICTREEYEKARAEKLGQEGEKWTHKHCGLRCRFLIDKPDREGYKVIVNELNEYYTVEDEELKPIKPKLTKVEKEMVAKFVAQVYTKQSYDLREEFDKFCDKHEITDDD